MKLKRGSDDVFKETLVLQHKERMKMSDRRSLNIMTVVNAGEIYQDEREISGEDTM